MPQTFDTRDDLVAALQAWPSDSQPLIQLTPALATNILEHDPINRKIRPGNLERLKREILNGNWDSQKSSAMRFMTSGQLADGQHRCLAVQKTGLAITVPMVMIKDLVGVDEGSPRTVADHLGLQGIPREESGVASAITHALCTMPSAGIRDYLAVFLANRDFILECVRKPQEWLAEQDRAISVIIKPALLAMIRAQAIKIYEEPAERVDELLFDIVNDGATAPEGSPRRHLAKQIFEHLRLAHERKGAKTRDVMTWVRNALKFSREGKVRNVITARLLLKKVGRPPKKRSTADADAA